MKEVKEVRIDFNDGKRDVYGKIKSYEIKGIKYVKGKGYYVDKSFDKWVVYEADIGIDEINCLRVESSWQVFKTKDKKKAIEVMKFLAERVEVE